MKGLFLRQFLNSLVAFAVVAVAVLLVAQLGQPPVALPEGAPPQNAYLLVIQRLPATLYLAALAAALALLVAIPLGLLGASNRWNPIGSVIRLLGLFASSLPNFVLVLFIIWLLVVKMEWLLGVPQGGSFTHLLFAALVLALFHVGPLVQLVQSMVLLSAESLDAASPRIGFVFAAKALCRTLSENPGLALSTYFGSLAAVLICGSVITEYVFGWPGAAGLAVGAALSFDLDRAAAVVLTFSFLFVAARLLVVTLHAYMEQRKSVPDGPAPTLTFGSTGLSTESLSGLSLPAVTPGQTTHHDSGPIPRFRKLPSAIAVIFLVSIVVLALFPSQISPKSPMEQALGDRLQAPLYFSRSSTETLPGSKASISEYPAWTFVLGSDYLGRDVLSRVIHSLSRSILYAVAAVGLAAASGVVLALVTEILGGWANQLISRIEDATRSIPAAALLAFTALSLSTWVTMLVAAGVLLWGTYFRHARRQVEMAHYNCGGESDTADSKSLVDVCRRLAPSIARTVAALAAMHMGFVVILQAGIDLVGMGMPGIGVSPPFPALGSMLAEGRQYMVEAWWLPLFPGLAILALAFGLNLMGQWLQRSWGPSVHPTPA